MCPLIWPILSPWIWGQTERGFCWAGPGCNGGTTKGKGQRNQRGVEHLKMPPLFPLPWELCQVSSESIQPPWGEGLPPGLRGSSTGGGDVKQDNLGCHGEPGPALAHMALEQRRR